MSIRIGILGYGNLGRGVECAIRQNEDMELAELDAITEETAGQVGGKTDQTAGHWAEQHAGQEDGNRLNRKADVGGGHGHNQPRQHNLYGGEQGAVGQGLGGHEPFGLCRDGCVLCNF